MDISKIKVGLQANIDQYNSPVTKCSLLDVFEGMRTSEKLKAKTEAVRAATTKEERDRLKKSLHGFIVSSETTCRKASDDDIHTGFLWADIDKFEGEDNPDHTLADGISLVKDLCRDYPYMIGYFISPGGNGIKVLCAIEPDVATHKMSFKAVSDLFAANGLNLDPSGSDAKRICFVCHDPNIKETILDPLDAWQGERIKPATPVKKKPYTFKGSSSSTLSADDEASLCLVHLDPDMPYHEWLRVGMALKEKGCSCAVWDAWSSGGQLYKAGLCERKWESFQGSGVGFGTVVQMAKDANGGINPIFPTKADKVTATASDFSIISEDGEVEVEENKLWNFLQKREFNEMEPPEVHPAILNLGDAGVLWKGNIHTLVAPSKSGKTHAMASMIRALVTGERALGWNCEKLKGRVVYLDFEQDAEDFYNVLAKHAGVTSFDVSAYRLAGLSALEAQQAVEMILEKIPDIDVIIMDGYADLTNDTNCSEESNGLVARWMSLVSDYDFALLGALHLNPNSDSKSRGHLGSQLERKSKTVLKIDVDAEGVRETYTQFARKQPVFKGKGVFWQWIDDGFVEVEDKATREAAEKLETERVEFDRFLRTQTTRQWSYKALVSGIESGLEVSERTAKSRIMLWCDNSFIAKHPTHYSLVQPSDLH